MPHVSHPLIRKGVLEEREYQNAVLETARKRNTLVCLPTGLGKTPVAMVLAAERLEKYPGSKVLVMAPTRPLVSQHFESFRKSLEVSEDRMQVLTGVIPPEKRKALYREKQMIFATPQTIQFDIRNKRLSLKEFSLLVLDEVHHAIGAYAYPFVSQAYMEEAEHPLILGLTASPGGTSQKIREICNNCGIESVEIRGEEDRDVSPYVQEKSVEWIEVDLPPSFLEIRNELISAYSRRIDSLKRMGFLRGRPGKKVLLELQGRMIRSIKQGNKKAFMGIRQVGHAIKLDHAIGLLETQGITSLESYWRKLRSDPKAKPLLEDPKVDRAMELTSRLFRQGSTHPKISTLCSLVSRFLKENPKGKIIVFASYREAVRDIVIAQGGIEGARPVEFIGQKGGLTQKEQVKRIEEFKEGKHNILVGTSISEEGLDIPAMDLAVFYEPVPSEIRSIQRRGRVGRQVAGKVIVLIAKNTRDEAYFWSARHKEKRMRETLHGMSMENAQDYKQHDLSRFGD